ncbi:hypothetical protein FQ192_26975 [Pseudomonas sp. ANT_J12]|nr:hypothetical protein FQ192_26975 [Pseudomonas sp. ANT_J12]
MPSGCWRPSSSRVDRPRSPVGAGLLAKAVGQPTSLLNVKPPSRASFAPTWGSSYTISVFTTAPL